MHSNKRLIRKGIHFLTGMAVLALTFLAGREAVLLLILLGSLFAFFTFAGRRFRWLHQSADGSLGTLFYPVGVLVSFLLLYRMPIHFFQISLLILTVSDTAAGVAGQIRPGNIFFRAAGEQKSLYGVIAFSIASIAIFWLLLPPSQIGVTAYVVLAIMLAITFEVISYRGSDNFSIPVGSALFFLVMDRHESNVLFLVAVVALVALGSWLLYRMGFLTRGAAVAVYFLGVYFIGVLGLSWSLPMVAFFLSSVVLTRIHSAVRGKKRSSGRRSLWQVLANSIWAILFSALYLITRDPVHIYLFISVVAAVTADTWASETGPVFHRRSFSLAHGQMRTSGVSGGITAAGSLASLIGALAIAWLGHILFFGETDTPAILALALAGFFSSFADSLLAAFAEPRMRRMTLFRIPAHQHQPAPTPNDVINALGSLTAPAFFLLFRIWGNMG